MECGVYERGDTNADTCPFGRYSIIELIFQDWVKKHRHILTMANIFNENIGKLKCLICVVLERCISFFRVVGWFYFLLAHLPPHPSRKSFALPLIIFLHFVTKNDRGKQQPTTYQWVKRGLRFSRFRSLRRNGELEGS